MNRLKRILRLHHAIVAPGPSSAEIEFLLAAGSGVGIVKVRGREDHTEFAQQFIQDCVAVGEPGEFNAIAVDVAHGCLFAGNNEFSEIAQSRRVTAKELNEGVRVLQRTGINDHRGETLPHAKS